MNASSWQYYCAVHSTPSNCCAIDYMTHTLDHCCKLLNSNILFPSRIHISEISAREFPAICRRIYRIFSHSYFHHREIFEIFQNETQLYQRFVAFCKIHNFIPENLYTISQL
eukprot:Sdes_comp18281_c0_seq1m7945